MTPSAPAPLPPLRLALTSAAAGLLLALLAVPLTPAGPSRPGWLLFAGALAAALLAPAVAAGPGDGSPWLRAGRGALCGAGGALGLALGGALLGGAPGALLGGAAYLALLGAALAAFAAGAGQVPASLLGLAACALPWWAARALAGLGDLDQLRAVLWSPLPALLGTFAGSDPLRQGSLYEAFPPGHSAQFVYLAPGEALLHLLPLLVLGALPLLLRGALRRAPRAGLGAALLLLALLGGAQPARAQAIFEPTPKEESAVGDLETRVVLGYWVTRLTGELKLDGENGVSGNDFSFTRHLDLDPLFVLPTFELGLNWDNGGRIWVQYIEAAWHGETQLGTTRRFEETELTVNSIIETRYKYRAISLAGELHIPVFDFATLRIIETNRYIKHEVKIRSFDGLNVKSVRDSLEALVPALGVGGDIMIWGPIFAYGDIQWLDFRTSILGGEDGRFKFHHLEYKVGVRLELVDHAHALVEWFQIEHSVKDGKGNGAHYYEQNLSGIRVQVAILF